MLLYREKLHASRFVVVVVVVVLVVLFVTEKKYRAWLKFSLTSDNSGNQAS